VDEASDRDVLRRYFTALARAAPGARPRSRALPAAVDEVHPARVRRSGVARRPVGCRGALSSFSAYPPEKLAEVMAAINRWGMGREMHVTELDQLALSLA